MPAPSTRPRKAAGATKKAASSVVDFDAARKKKKVTKRTGKLRYQGELWDLKEPNVALVGRLEESESLGALPTMLAAHVVKEQREDFLRALEGDEDLGLEMLNELLDAMLGELFGDIPSDPA